MLWQDLENGERNLMRGFAGSIEESHSGKATGAIVTKPDCFPKHSICPRFSAIDRRPTVSPVHDTRRYMLFYLQVGVEGVEKRSESQTVVPTDTKTNNIR